MGLWTPVRPSGHTTHGTPVRGKRHLANAPREHGNYSKTTRHQITTLVDYPHAPNPCISASFFLFSFGWPRCASRFYRPSSCRPAQLARLPARISFGPTYIVHCPNDTDDDPSHGDEDAADRAAMVFLTCA